MVKRAVKRTTKSTVKRKRKSPAKVTVIAPKGKVNRKRVAKRKRNPAKPKRPATGHTVLQLRGHDQTFVCACKSPQMAKELAAELNRHAKPGVSFTVGHL